MSTGIYVGTVSHRRLSPRQHKLRYRTYSLLFDIDRIGDTAAKIPLLSHNKRNVLSIHDRDYGPRNGTPLRPWIDAQLAAAGIDLDGGSIQLLAYPRILGYTFNPLTIWFCYHQDGALRAVLYEIHNTFGHSHSHLIPISGSEPHRHHFDKELHVSPFFDREGSYSFTLRPPGERFSISIDYSVGGEKLLTATMNTTRRALTSRNILGVFLSHPLLTFKVIAGIHWNALKLWAKGAKYRPVPAPPDHSVTFEGELEGAK